jgi:hypothetical protein
MYTKDQLLYIAYNNRTVEGCVAHFLPKNIDPLKIIELEKKIDFINQMFGENIGITLLKDDLDLECDDIIITPEDITSIQKDILNSVNVFTEQERIFLNNRNINEDIIKKYSLGGLSNITENRKLEIINALTHPLLKKVLPTSGIEGGGIIIPLIENGKVINTTIRKIVDINKLKYCTTIPDVNIWFLNEINENDEVWITEGIFDAIALKENGLKTVSISAASWSSIQFYLLIEKKPKLINIFCDYDHTGLKTGYKAQKIFNLHSIPNKTWITEYGKDPAEHIFEKHKTIQDIREIKITKSLIEETKTDELKHRSEFNFMDYLKMRKF